MSMKWEAETTITTGVFGAGIQVMASDDTNPQL
jgi:hypothetical protein